MADAERPIGSGLAAPLIMSGESDGGASPQRSNNNRAYPQAVGTPPRVGPPGQVSRSPGGTPMATTISPKQRSAVGRLSSLDAVRGMTVCVMIFVDNVGGWIGAGSALPVGHSPWDDVTLADFVMPFFLFMVGCSMSLSFSKYNGSIALTYKIIGRTAKLFLIGVA
jgi:heparan-alpha-glucosaminide N-acetyltransferase